MRAFAVSVGLLLIAGVAFAGDVWKTGNQMQPGPFGPGTGASSPASIECTAGSDGTQAVCFACFANSGNQTAAFTFAYPRSNAGFQFHPILDLHGTTIFDGHSAKIAVTLEVNTLGGDITGGITGTELTYGSTGTEFVPTGFDATEEIDVIGNEYAWDLTNVRNCSAPSACQGKLVLGRIQRIDTEDVCVANYQPYFCCTGNGTGTCAPSSEYAGKLCVSLLGLF